MVFHSLLKKEVIQKMKSKNYLKTQKRAKILSVIILGIYLANFKSDKNKK